MTTKLGVLAFVTFALATLPIAHAGEPKHGGILRIYHRETPPSLSIHEEATFSVNSGDGPLQQPGRLRSAQAPEFDGHDRS
jgi:hypothetical protein